MKKLMVWIIVLLVGLIFIFTTPKTYESYKASPRYDKINNYILFTTCSCMMGDGEYKVNKIGILGQVIKITDMPSGAE